MVSQIQWRKKDEEVAVAWGGPEARNKRLGGCLCRCHSGPDGCLEGEVSLGAGGFDAVVVVVVAI